jgi:hypothetical protein
LIHVLGNDRDLTQLSGPNKEYPKGVAGTSEPGGVLFDNPEASAETSFGPHLGPGSSLVSDTRPTKPAFEPGWDERSSLEQVVRLFYM